MNIYCDIVEPSADANVSLERLTKDFARMFGDAWTKDKLPIYKRNYSPNIGAISRLWLDKTLKLFYAYDMTTNKPIGYLFGVVYRPLSYDAYVMRVEDWYGEVPEAVSELFKYVKQALRFLGCDELLIADDLGNAPDLSDSVWRLGNEFKFCRYVRQ